MPVEELAEKPKDFVCHDWSAFVFDLVEQANNVATPDGVDLSAAKLGIDQAIECPRTLLGGTKSSPFAEKVFLTNSFDRVL
jgi:hypothetical protein